MKNLILIIFFAGSILITSCHTGSNPQSGKDTVKNIYGGANDTTNASKSNIDTSKMTTTTGGASDEDDGGSGGTKIAKDTSKQKVQPKK
ncbi:MAG: hypothetical protein ACHQHN_17655 [Sphingobacteriales bacterium]